MRGRRKRLCLLTTALVFNAVVLLAACGPRIRETGLVVDITSYLGDEQVFYARDQLSFLISLNDDAWLYLFYENAEGKLYQLIPSVLSPDNRLAAGDFIEFPPPQSSFAMEITAPFGRERVWLLASEKRLDLPASLNADLSEIHHSLEAIKNSLLQQLRKSRVRYAQDELFFNTAEG